MWLSVYHGYQLSTYGRIYPAYGSETLGVKSGNNVAGVVIGLTVYCTRVTECPLQTNIESTSQLWIHRGGGGGCWS